MRKQAKQRKSVTRRRTGRGTALDCWIRVNAGPGDAHRRCEVRVSGKAPARRPNGRQTASRALFRGIDPTAVAQLLSSLGHPVRVAIVGRLLQDPCRYADLVKSVGLKAGPLYHHISNLRLAGLISASSGRDRYELTTTGARFAVLVPAIARLARMK